MRVPQEPMALAVEFPWVTFYLLVLVTPLTYAPLGTIIRRHSISLHNSADDTQLCFTVCPDDTEPVDPTLTECYLWYV